MNELVDKYILENNNDGLFDLAFNYGDEIDLNKIALHFIDIKSSYDICELLSLEAENLDLELIFDEIVKTKDEEFIFLVYKSGVISSIIPDCYFGKLSEFLYH